MKKKNKDSMVTCSNSAENLCADRLEQQKVQQRYHGELEKYREQINRIEKPRSKDDQAA